MVLSSLTTVLTFAVFITTLECKIWVKQTLDQQDLGLSSVLWGYSISCISIHFLQNTIKTLIPTQLYGVIMFARELNNPNIYQELSTTNFYIFVQKMKTFSWSFSLFSSSGKWNIFILILKIYCLFSTKTLAGHFKLIIPFFVANFSHFIV